MTKKTEKTEKMTIEEMEIEVKMLRQDALYHDQLGEYEESYLAADEAEKLAAEIKLAKKERCK